ncbi:hypothetical protein, partial [Ruminococcus sp.]|uniref:hypothetical protein n=1 Tax=Ruminococcus sp. TaxID=41978 RepID=UPI001B03BC9F
PNKEKEPGTDLKGSAKLFFLWYNIIAKTIKPTKGSYHKNEKLSSANEREHSAFLNRTMVSEDFCAEASQKR